MNTKTKIELFTSQKPDCCSSDSNTNTNSCCSGDSSTCDCEGCEVTVYQENDARAKELEISKFPGLAINGQVIRCDSISKAIEQSIGSCCCC